MLISMLSMEQRKFKQDSMNCFREAVDQLVAESEGEAATSCSCVFVV